MERRTLDPIVSLSVAIAEQPGSFAFFLGSGVSNDAGVPTGADVFWQAVAELHRAETESEDVPDRGGLEQWLEQTGRADLDYSGILELIAPDAPTRRAYLAKHFEKAEPGPAHERLAELAKSGDVRVFITTNFDRLLERALQARGITPIVVTSAAELASAPRREHAECYIVKPHGDYLQETIRNTRGELADLGPELDAELREIVNRFGLVVLGYRGADEAIAEIIKSRTSRYTLYWVSRGEPGAAAKAVIDAAGGRLIQRITAADFVGDLQRRLSTYGDHPTGHTPLEVHDEVLKLLREKDQIGLSEVMRRERREFAEAIGGNVERFRQQRPTDELYVEAYSELFPALERRLASLLPLIAHEPAAFEFEVRSLSELLERQTREGGYTIWFEVPAYATWWVAYLCGGFAVRLEQWEAVRHILDATFTVESFSRRLAEPVRESVGHEMCAAVLAQESEQRWISPRWVALIAAVRDLAILKERWPELLSGEREPDDSLEGFDFVNGIRIGLDGGSPAAYWSISWSGAVSTAQKLRTDDRYRRAVAEALDINPDDFIEKAKEGLERARPFDGYAESQAFAVLTGQR